MNCSEGQCYKVAVPGMICSFIKSLYSGVTWHTRGNFVHINTLSTLFQGLSGSS